MQAAAFYSIEIVGMHQLQHAVPRYTPRMLHEDKMLVCYWLLRNSSRSPHPSIHVTHSDTLTALYIAEEMSRREGGREDSRLRGKIGQRERGE